MSSPLETYRGVAPRLGQRVFVHRHATVIGDVALADDVSIWPGAVLRGDVNSISIGEGSNIQDLSVLHVTHRRPEDPEGAPVVIGRHVTVGHHVVLHGCQIGDECLIGMGAIILDRAVIESQVMIGAGTLVPPGKVLASGYLYLGQPARAVRALTAEELAHLRYSAEHYVRLKNEYLEPSSR